MRLKKEKEKRIQSREREKLDDGILKKKERKKTGLDLAGQP